ncbi:AMP deaminase [Ranunculus cassubicifolius]
MHKKTLSHLLHLAKNIDQLHHHRDTTFDQYDDDEELDKTHRILPIPNALPPLRKGHSLPKGGGSFKRAGPIIRPTSPKSTVASATGSVYESVQGSDEEEEDVLADIMETLDTSDLHVNGDDIWFSDFKESDHCVVRLGNGYACRVRGIGTIKLKLKNGNIMELQNVRYLPNFKANLISLGILESSATEKLYPVADATTFFTDLHHILRVIAAGNIRTLCYHRLVLLEQKFKLHLMLNADREFLAQKSAPHRDFYNVRKVDTHVHHSACMNQKHLLRFIKSKLRKEPDELTLREVFESLDLTGYDLNVDLLDVHADKSSFHRFDKFNLKYNPCGQSRLREIFLKQDNLIQGKFLLTLHSLSYLMAEYRISIYGRKQSEWDQLASWIVNNDLYSENVVWLIQLPRLYNVYKEMGIVTSFQNMLDNIFLPLFEVTVDPDSHPQLHVFLKQVVGLDLVDDESKPERRPTKHMPKPSEWTNIFNPAFSYYVYYCYANLYTLNKRGLRTVHLHPATENPLNNHCKILESKADPNSLSIWLIQNRSDPIIKFFVMEVLQILLITDKINIYHNTVNPPINAPLINAQPLQLHKKIWSHSWDSYVMLIHCGISVRIFIGLDICESITNPLIEKTFSQGSYRGILKHNIRTIRTICSGKG